MNQLMKKNIWIKTSYILMMASSAMATGENPNISLDSDEALKESCQTIMKYRKVEIPDRAAIAKEYEQKLKTFHAERAKLEPLARDQAYFLKKYHNKTKKFLADESNGLKEAVEALNRNRRYAPISKSTKPRSEVERHYEDLIATLETQTREDFRKLVEHLKPTFDSYHKATNTPAGDGNGYAWDDTPEEQKKYGISGWGGQRGWQEPMNGSKNPCWIDFNSTPYVSYCPDRSGAPRTLIERTFAVYEDIKTLEVCTVKSSPRGSEIKLCDRLNFVTDTYSSSDKIDGIDVMDASGNPIPVNDYVLKVAEERAKKEKDTKFGGHEVCTTVYDKIVRDRELKAAEVRRKLEKEEAAKRLAPAAVAEDPAKEIGAEIKF